MLKKSQTGQRVDRLAKYIYLVFTLGLWPLQRGVRERERKKWALDSALV